MVNDSSTLSRPYWSGIGTRMGARSVWLTVIVNCVLPDSLPSLAVTVAL